MKIICHIDQIKDTPHSLTHIQVTLHSENNSLNSTVNCPNIELVGKAFQLAYFELMRLMAEKSP